METEGNRVIIVRRESDQNQVNKENHYYFEVELFTWKKILILILNILTGGLGTMLEPFLYQKISCKLIILGILLGLLQIFHILHFFSLFKEIEFIEKFYDYISDDSVIMKIIYQSENDDKDDKIFLKQLFGIENISEIISKDERKKFLKYTFGLLSGMSYCNSIFSVITNFLNKNDDEPNYRFGIKTILYSIFNPGGGFLISSVVLIDSCKCNENEKCAISGFFLSFFSLLISLFLMICPYILGTGLYLMKITENNIELYPIKFLLIFIGVMGTILSFSFSYIKRSAVVAAYKEKIKTFDIVWECHKSITNIKSDFGLSSLIRMILNLIVPGLGTYSLFFKNYCSYCCCNDNTLTLTFSFKISYLFMSVIEVVYGGIFLCLLFTIINNILAQNSDFNITIPLIFNVLQLRDHRELVITNTRAFECLYSLTFFHYISGIIIIVISDYYSNINIIFEAKKKKFFIIISILVLNFFTGGLGTILFMDLLLYTNENPSQCWRYLCIFSFFCCCDAKMSKMFIIGFISIIVHSFAYSSLFFSDIFMLNYAKYLSVPIFLVIYISTAIYYNHILNKLK